MQAEIEYYLMKQGLQAESKNGQFVMDCPFCGKENKLYISENSGLWDCKTCGEKGSFNWFKKRLKEVVKLDGETEVSTEIVKEFSMEQVLAYHRNLDKYDYIKNYISGKKLNPEVIDNLLWGADEKGNMTIPHIYKDKVYGIRLVHFKDGKKVGVSMVTGGHPIVINQEFLDTEPDSVLLVEGEPDYATALSYGIKEVICVPGITFRKGDWIPKLKEIKNVYICFDRNDKKDAGQKQAYELGRRIGLENCKNVLLPCNDLNECLQAGLPYSVIEKAIKEARRFPLAGTSSAEEFQERMMQKLLRPGELRGARCGLNELDNVMSGWPESKFIVIAGYPKVGKTSFASHILYKLALQNKPVYLFSLETEPEEIIATYMTKKARKAYAELQGEEFKTYVSQVNDMPIHYYDREKETRPLDKERLFAILKENRDRYGIKYVLLDNISKVVLSTKQRYGSGELAHLDGLVNELFTTCKDLDITIIGIAHISKPADSDMSRLPTANKIRGSVELGYIPDYVIIVHRDVEAPSEEVQRRVKIKVSYNRPTGKTGVIDLRYDVGLANYEEV